MGRFLWSLFIRYPALMSVSVLTWLLVAFFVFWCVGLYNRLMRLRARGLDALGSVEKNLRTYTSLMDAQFPAEEGCFVPLPWADLARHVQSIDLHCRAVRSAPLAVAPLRALGHLIDAIEQEWLGLCSHVGSEERSVQSDALQKLWQEAALKVRTARGGFNQIVDRYNEALHQFPASMAVGMMGFKEAGKL